MLKNILNQDITIMILGGKQTQRVHVTYYRKRSNIRNLEDKELYRFLPINNQSKASES